MLVLCGVVWIAVARTAGCSNMCIQVHTFAYVVDFLELKLNLFEVFYLRVEAARVLKTIRGHNYVHYKFL